MEESLKFKIKFRINWYHWYLLGGRLNSPNLLSVRDLNTPRYPRYSHELRGSWTDVCRNVCSISFWPVISFWIASGWLCRPTQLFVFLRINCALHCYTWSQLRVEILNGRYCRFINSLSWQELSTTCYVLRVCSLKYH
jgi:hypothetical protein